MKLFSNKKGPVTLNSYQRNPYSDKYYKDMEKIESMWSVMHNLKLFSGEQADAFEMSCKKNINLYHQMIEYDMKNLGLEQPKHAPCYVRLAMLYEKQGRYKDAIDICVMAIRAGAYDDHSNGKMYGRLARMIKKSGMEASPEIQLLTKGGL